MFDMCLAWCCRHDTSFLVLGFDFAWGGPNSEAPEAASGHLWASLFFGGSGFTRAGDPTACLRSCAFVLVLIFSTWTRNGAVSYAAPSNSPK